MNRTSHTGKKAKEIPSRQEEGNSWMTHVCQTQKPLTTWVWKHQTTTSNAYLHKRVLFVFFSFSSKEKEKEQITHIISFRAPMALLTQTQLSSKGMKKNSEPKMSGSSPKWHASPWRWLQEKEDICHSTYQVQWQGTWKGDTKRGELCYRVQMSPKLHLIWGWVESSDLFRGQFRSFTWYQNCLAKYTCGQWMAIKGTKGSPR